MVLEPVLMDGFRKSTKMVGEMMMSLTGLLKYVFNHFSNFFLIN